MMKRTIMKGTSLLSGFGLNPFAKDELDRIHNATLEVFQNTGIKVESDEAGEILHGAGASVERYGNYATVKIPPHIVEDCIRWAPGSIAYRGRYPKDDFVAEPNKVTFSTFGECAGIIDLFSGKIDIILKVKFFTTS